MYKNFLLIVIYFAFLTLNLGAYEVKEIISIEQVNKEPIAETLYMFDVDDTIIDFPYMMGSQSWRRYITKVLGKELHDKLSLHLVKNVDVIPVESTILQLKEELYSKGHLLVLLTARERNKWYSTEVEGVDVLTLNQVAQVGFNIKAKEFEERYPELTKDSDYFSGGYFVTFDSKGDYLLHLFKNIPCEYRPKKIIFIDDKDTQAISVAKALEELNIDYECYHYTALVEKSKNFDPMIANIQLLYFLEKNILLSDFEAAKIAKNHPEQTEVDYLKNIFELAKEL